MELTTNEEKNESSLDTTKDQNPGFNVKHIFNNASSLHWLQLVFQGCDKAPNSSQQD